MTMHEDSGKEFRVVVKCSSCGHDIELIVHSETAFKFLKGYDRAICSVCNENSKWKRVDVNELGKYNS